MFNWKSTCLAACCMAAFVPSFGGVELKKESYGMLKNTPTYIQEWHIWWGFPYPDAQQPFSHMDSTLTSDREPWRLNWNRNGYPLVGLYDAANPEIMRWQIRCMKAAGLDSVAVMIHPDNGKGIEFIQEEGKNMIQTILDIAAEEQFPVFFMDEVAFRKGSVCQKPDVMAKRVIRFIKKYASQPGFYKIDGKPVYYFQTYGWPVKAEELEAMFAEVEKEAGPVHWMIFGAVNRFGKIPQLAQVVDGASNHRRSSETRAWQLKEQSAEAIFSAGHKLGKKITDMQYPKFDGTSQPWRQTGVSQYGLGGRMLETTITDSFKSNPDFIMLSSWNDWEEGANFEPGWDFDGFDGDPYVYCKVIAHLRGREFVPPPMPPKEAVHPSIWEKLGYGDGAGPLVEKIERSHNRGGALTVTARDTASEVTGLEVIWNGDSYFLAPQTPAGKPAGTITVKGQFPGSEQLQNVFGFTPGRAIRAGNSALEFLLPDAAGIPETFTIGIAYAFNPEKPLPKVTAKVTNRTPVQLREPKGGVQPDTTFDFSPSPRDNQFPAEIWNGWRTAAAVNPRLVDLSKGIRIQADGEKIGFLSLLGNPKEERVLTAGNAIDKDGKIKQFHITLPDSVLGVPGAHFVWLRARDAAGNWGSPVLYAVPNYEFFDRSASGAAPEAELSVPGALLADNCATSKNWKAIAGRASTQPFVEKTTYTRLLLGNDLLLRELPKPVTAGEFKLTFDATHLNNQRYLIVWLTDAEGKNGYGIGWDSAKPDQSNGNGIVRILKLDGTPVEWGTQGKRLADAESGHPALSEIPARFEFSGKDGVLTLKVDGKTVATAKDDSFKNFKRLYLRGNQSQTIDSIVLTGK